MTPKNRLDKLEHKRGKPGAPVVIVVWGPEENERETITLPDGTVMTKAEYLRTHPEEFEQIVIEWPE